MDSGLLVTSLGTACREYGEIADDRAVWKHSVAQCVSRTQMEGPYDTMKRLRPKIESKYVRRMCVRQSVD